MVFEIIQYNTIYTIICEQYMYLYIYIYLSISKTSVHDIMIIITHASFQSPNTRLRPRSSPGLRPFAPEDLRLRRTTLACAQGEWSHHLVREWLIKIGDGVNKSKLVVNQTVVNHLLLSFVVPWFVGFVKWGYPFSSSSIHR